MQRAPIVSARWITAKKALISFSEFPGDEATLEKVRTILADYSTADTLIFDLRGHKGGGLGEMNLIFPEIYKRPLTLLEMDTRAAVAQKYGSPMAKERFVREVPGPEGMTRHQHFVEPASQAYVDLFR